MRMAAGEGSTEPVEDDNDKDNPAAIDDGPSMMSTLLKYANLTKTLPGLYRNGDAASAFFVAGDKLVIGTHNGNIHILALPSLDPLRVYHAHAASVSSISISPYPPPLPTIKLDPASRGADTLQRAPVPNMPSNQIFIATSSIDGNVCVSSLVDSKDQLRNFGRPLQAVALSPEFKSDRNYLSGGQAGSLILTNGGQSGKRANASTTSTVAAASGWLGSIGLGENTGTDRVLHTGEGTISTIKWSLTGNYVLWVNEMGIKIMRSDLHLDSHEAGSEWQRISHIDKPTRPGWEEMAGVWKARAEWINPANLEQDHDNVSSNGLYNKQTGSKSVSKKKTEDVLVGWGDTVWLIKVLLAQPSDGKSGAAKKLARAEVATIIRFDDCTISGISLYTPTLLLVLAYMERKAGKGPAASDGTKKGRRHRQNALEPELRLIDINTNQEVDTDTLTISRYESLSAADYHIAILPPMTLPASLVPKGVLASGITALGTGLYTGVETVGQGMWDATMYAPRKLGASRMFSGASSVQSANAPADSEKAPSTKDRNYLTAWLPGFGSSTNQAADDVRDVAQTSGMKIFIFSPYDCIVAVKRDLADRLHWLTEKKRYQEAWELLDGHPEAADRPAPRHIGSPPQTPSKASSVAHSDSLSTPLPAQVRQQATLTEFFADTSSLGSTSKPKLKDSLSAAEKEKGRLADLWLKQLVATAKWTEAGEVAARVLNTTTAWETWVWVFIKNSKFDEISPYVPALELTPPLPPLVYEVILGYYVSTSADKFKHLLDLWPSDLFDIGSITSAVREQLKSGSPPPASHDWRLLQECLAKLFLADGHYHDALKCYIQLHDADTALALIKDHHLIESVIDDIPAFVQLRVSADQLKTAPREDLEDLASEPIKLLVDEAESGVVQPDDVVSQLESAGLNVFLFFYLRALWRGEGSQKPPTTPKVGHSAAVGSLATDSAKSLVEDFADVAVELFANFDRPLLNDFLHTCTTYAFDKAAKICEQKHYFDELVYLLSKTGQMKKALFLIIDELGHVTKAIEFAKEQHDQDLWDDFLEYSMSRPKFIAGLLAEVGMAIDPVALIKRIPAGLEIEGLKQGLKKLLREYDLQDSISSGVAQVLNTEVAVGMDKLRRGRRKGIKFDLSQPNHHPAPAPSPKSHTGENATEAAPANETDTRLDPGQCVSCRKFFNANDKDTLVGFACGHIYHLSHLLHGPHAEGTKRIALPAGSDQEETEGFARSIDPKVTTARLLREKVEAVGGCTICKERKERVREAEGTIF
ncbi:hypothetical protein DV736_g4812, partial [Chaetothyriales sp. CBS 134916]